ncbi:MAG: fimbrillin family protein [Mediterranea sp.]|jgi:uncharacterized protein YcfL|nr:fimbrillin family protein [Mediterranea sp.]
MKKYSIAPLVVLLCAACTDNTVVPVDAAGTVAFTAQTSAAARGTSIEGKSDLQTAGFCVYAWLTDSNDWSNAIPATTAWFDGAAVAWSTSSWTYTPMRYWPDAAGLKASFFAYAPADAVVTMQSTSGNPAFEYTVPNTAADQCDLLAAQALDRTKSAAVPLTFDHLLARIGFKARLSKHFAGATLTVTSLKVKYTADKIANKGVYTFGGSPGQSAGAWTLTDAGTSSMATSGGGDELLSDSLPLSNNTAGEYDTPLLLNDAGKYLMMLPQSLPENAFSVEVAWIVEQADEIIHNAIRTVTFPSSMIWQAGKAYSYTLLFLANEVQAGGVTVENWGGSLTYERAAVTYKANGGTGDDVVRHGWTNSETILLTQVDNGNPFAPPTDKPVLAKWSTATNGTGTDYMPGASVTLTGDLTLYAIWSN